MQKTTEPDAYYVRVRMERLCQELSDPEPMETGHRVRAQEKTKCILKE